MLCEVIKLKIMSNIEEAVKVIVCFESRLHVVISRIIVKNSKRICSQNRFTKEKNGIIKVFY